MDELLDRAERVLTRRREVWAQADKLIVPSEEIDRYTQDTFADQVKPAGAWRSDLVELLLDPQVSIGYGMPWSKARHIRLRPAELTIWAGYNGHGKSLMLTQVMLGVMSQGAKVCIASLELSPLQTLRRMACQTVGVAWDELSKLAVEEFFAKSEGTLWLYSEVGDIEPGRVLALCRYVRELGVEHVVIDSLMKCGTTEGEYREEKKLVNSLQNVAKNTGLHIHLVAHSKKSKNEYEIPGKFDVSGSTHITNIADNVITVSRNKRKEEERIKPNPDPKEMERYDAYLRCDKQRHGDWEGTLGLYWHQSGQYTEQENRVEVLL